MSGFKQHLFCFSLFSRFQTSHSVSENKQVMLAWILLFIYFILFVCKPSKPKPPKTAPNFNNPFKFSVDQPSPNQLVFKTNRGKEWKIDLPDPFYWENGRISERDDCFGGKQRVRARGRKLFEFQTHFPRNQPKNVSNFINMDTDMFYFECENHRIKELSICPVGTRFDGEKCISVDKCANSFDGFKYPAESLDTFFECQKGKSHLMSCPPKHSFILDRCVKNTNVCLGETDGTRIRIDRKRYFECRGEKPVTQECASDFYFHPEGSCQPVECEGKSNAQVRISSATHGPFRFHPYYGDCQNGKLVSKHTCSDPWDHSKLNVNLLSLSRVFHEGFCLPPDPCVNVDIDSDVIMPNFEYSKHLSQWKYARLFDSTIGWHCSGPKVLSQKYLHPGMLVKNFKISEGFGRVPINSDSTRFFDWGDQKIKACPKDHFYNGDDCVPEDERNFKFRHLDVFRFQELDPHNNWVTSRHEIPGVKKSVCQANEMLHHKMNVCIDRDCARFEFVKELGKPIKIDDKYHCVFKNGSIVKEEYKSHPASRLDFWNQKMTQTDDATLCISGTRVKSGNFLLDSTLFRTCKDSQPFVFCPSNSTTGIDEHSGRFYCVPDVKVWSFNLPADTRKKLKGVERVQLPPSVFKYQMDGGAIQDKTIPQRDYVKPNTEFWAEVPVEVHLDKIDTNPSDIILKRDKFGNVTAEEDSSLKPLTFSSYTPTFSLNHLQL